MFGSIKKKRKNLRFQLENIYEEKQNLFNRFACVYVVSYCSTFTLFHSFLRDNTIIFSDRGDDRPMANARTKNEPKH